MEFFKFNENLLNLANETEEGLKENFKNINLISQHNENKVLKAFLECKVSSSHFTQSTGYAYDDFGRDKLDELYSKIFKSEDALVRHNFVCGTHVISTVLFAVLKPKEKMLSITSTPYPTIRKTIGIEKSDFKNSLIDLGVLYDEIDVFKENKLNLKELKTKLKEEIKLIYIQRSKGYSVRKAVNMQQIKLISETVHTISPKTIVFVDNCYGEFVEEQEPIEVGADLACGSLIKNPGGGIAKTGGYVVGEKNLIALVSEKLTAPGLGKEIGSSLNQNKDMFFGIFISPFFVSNALKVSVFTRKIFQNLGFKVFPNPSEKVSDIVSVLELNSKKALVSFCEALQKNSPINSFLTPTPSKMPGYENEIIMASGGFVNGASLELSCDAQLKPPYNVFLQGGLSYNSSKTTILKTIEKLITENLIEF